MRISHISQVFVLVFILLNLTGCVTGQAKGGIIETSNCVQRTEICDGKDNNCNSLIDENLSKSCGSTNIGTCRKGVQICVAGIWGKCTGSVYPANEICDGKDNNCDGLIDNKLNCQNCTDSDGGIINGTFGIVNFDKLNFSDMCINNSTLREMFCQNNLPQNTSIPCLDKTNVCREGECQYEAPSTFLQTDYAESGWDPGITKKCAKTGMQPSLMSSYSESAECTNDGKNWLIGFHSESSYDASGQCLNKFDLSDPESPVKINWMKKADGKWQVQLFSDYSANPHPCGENYFNWFTLMDANPTQDYPNPQNLAVNYTLWYDYFLPYGTANGAARVIATWQGFWKDKDGNLIAHSIELNLNSVGWGDADPNPKIISTLYDNNLEFVFAEGSVYNLSVPNNNDTIIFIDWARIINDLVHEGYLSAPVDWNQSATGAVGIGVETNNIASADSIITNLYIKNFVILERSNLVD